MTSPRKTAAKAAAILGICSGIVTGCGARVDMSGIYEPKQAHTTVAYEGVHEESRLYPDYGAIRGDILVPGTNFDEAP